MKRSLHVKKEWLAELTPAELGGVAAAYAVKTTTTYALVAELGDVATIEKCPLSGPYPTLPVMDCV